MMGSIDPETVKRRLRFDYVRVKNEPGSRAVDGIITLSAHLHKPQININEVTQEAADIIQRHFRLKWVMIGIKGKNDGLFRYNVMSGMNRDIWERQRKKVYRSEDFEPSCGAYKYGDISDLTRVYLQEENPLQGDEMKLVQRPALLESKRLSSSETLETDFIDTVIYGPGRDLLGWIEYSGTVANEFPQPVVIRQIEGYAAILGVAIAMHLRS